MPHVESDRTNDLCTCSKVEGFDDGGCSEACQCKPGDINCCTGFETKAGHGRRYNPQRVSPVGKEQRYYIKEGSILNKVARAARRLDPGRTTTRKLRRLPCVGTAHCVSIQHHHAMS